jgi:glutathione synthase/RimK-type ligase-like ATP-grasp enzyme
LAGVPGIVMPPVARTTRTSLEQVARGERSVASILGDLRFPFIVRPVGSHAGRGLIKCEDAGAITPYLQRLLDEEFYLSRFVDYAGADGLFRKYRVVLIEGRPFICHMAVSSHWMVHYLNAGMGEDAHKRDEEAQAMASFDEGFARTHARALASIAERFGLQYVGIDCAETRDRELIVFELDSGPIVHAMDPIDVFPYKQAPMGKLFAAFRAMLEHAQARALEPAEAQAE